ncbi:MAG: glycosyltransferase family 4 protein [Acidobacteriota bacterium]|nr:glycosyltransferase family 4 protein [Blastocatellia bacterium]MDW8411604.1 glycosyltransferase family 4 protein [Acidobacteriota bacterium]
MFNNLFPPIKSGSSHFTYRLSKMLVERGHDVTVVAAKIPGSAARESLDGIDVHRLECWMLPQLEIAHNFRYLSYTFFPSNVRYVKRLLIDKGIQVLHQHGQIFDTALTSAYLGQSLALPLVNTIHTPVLHTVPFYLRTLVLLDKLFVKHFIIRYAKIVIAPDKTVVDNINERYQHPWIEVVPYGIDKPNFDPAKGIEIRRKYKIGDRPLILSLGHVHNLRDRCDLIEAMPHIRKAVGDVVLLIVGDVYTQKPVELADRLGLKDCVIFAGSVPHSEVGDYLAACDIEAHWLSNAPGLGIAAMEAMSVGVPVISSIGADDLGEGLLKNGENILLIERGSIESITNACVALLRDPDYRRQVGEKGKRVIEENFSWESVTDRMEAVYKKLIAS